MSSTQKEEPESKTEEEIHFLPVENGDIKVWFLEWLELESNPCKANEQKALHIKILNAHPFVSHTSPQILEYNAGFIFFSNIFEFSTIFPKNEKNYAKSQ